MTPSIAPESESQARTWDRVNRFAVDAGLCHGCASQLVWGSQNGFATVRPPCDRCAPLVATWPEARPSGWRTPTRRLSDATSWVNFRDNRARDVAGTPGKPLVDSGAVPVACSGAVRARQAVSS